MNLRCFLAMTVFLLVANLHAQPKQNKFSKPDFAGFVNPFVGTAAHGHTYPGALVPFGAVQLSPDTRIDGWDGCGGYHYSDSVVFGFSHTHLSGVGVSDYGDVLMMPFVDEVQWNRSGYGSRFRHATERATAGYYAVQLDKHSIDAELTATARCGLHKYTFPKTVNSTAILIDLQHRDIVLESGITIAAPNRIEGFRRSEAWAKDQVVYFVAEFSQPFVGAGIAVDDALQEGLRAASGKNVKAFVRFAPPLQPQTATKDAQKNLQKDLRSATLSETVLVRVGISSVSIEGARKNLAAELPHWDFERTRNEARALWNKELGAIEVTGGTEEQRRVFYTALYHTMSAPNLFMDVDGQYRGVDKNIHRADGFENYTIFSLWDTFRAAHPLYTLIQPKRTADFINTFLVQREQGGRLPVWELAGNETDCMIGYHSVSVIADAMAKGIAGFDYNRAFAAMRHSAELDHFGLSAYKAKGYIPVDDESESVSRTLEYAYDDWCIAQAAQMLGQRVEYETFLRRSLSYRNVFDRETGFMRGRKNGSWYTPFDPREVNFNYTEANSWQYSFFVPHDVAGLAWLLGGNERLEAKIDELFRAETATTGREQSDITGLIGQYAHGNEPSHHVAFLYNALGKPWKAQRLVRRIMDSLYSSQPDGLPGNEDCGQMSAWFVMSALGLYAATPGSPFYQLSTPLFPEARIHLAGGKTFTIKAPAVSRERCFVRSVTLNGKPHTKSFVSHAEIVQGGEIVFAVAASADSIQWGTRPEDRFVPAVQDADVSVGFVPVPFVNAPSRSFKDQMTVRLGCLDTTAKILYTTDSSAPDERSSLYNQPFTISTTCTVRSVAINAAGQRSFPTEAKFLRVNRAWNVKLLSRYDKLYAGGGDSTVIDGLRGGKDFHGGAWQGYQGQDFEAIVDLGNPQAISKIGAGFLQDIRSWIWMPARVECALSSDGATFAPAFSLNTSVPANDYAPRLQDFVQTISPQTARYVKIIAKNFGTIPAWHLGAGGKSWIFVDEIVIE